MLVAGIILNAAGAMGAGDAKFLAAAAPYVALGDIHMLMALFAAILLAAVSAVSGKVSFVVANEAYGSFILPLPPSPMP